MSGRSMILYFVALSLLCACATAKNWTTPVKVFEGDSYMDGDSLKMVVDTSSGCSHITYMSKLQLCYVRLTNKDVLAKKTCFDNGNKIWYYAFAIAHDGKTLFMLLGYNITTHMDMEVALMESTDNGDTWGTPVVLPHKFEGFSRGRPDMRYYPTSKTLVFAYSLVMDKKNGLGFQIRKNGVFGEEKMLDLFTRRDDYIEGITEIQPTFNEKDNVMNVLANYFNRSLNAGADNLSKHTIKLFSSTDNGNTWTSSVVVEKLAQGTLAVVMTDYTVNPGYYTFMLNTYCAESGKPRNGSVEFFSMQDNIPKWSVFALEEGKGKKVYYYGGLYPAASLKERRYLVNMEGSEFWINYEVNIDKNLREKIYSPATSRTGAFGWYPTTGGYNGKLVYMNYSGGWMLTSDYVETSGGALNTVCVSLLAVIALLFFMI